MWVWVNSGSWWWTGRLGMLRFMGSQRVGHDWATELNWMGLDAMIFIVLIFSFKPTLSLSSFTLIKRLFNSSLLSAICISEMLIFLPAILIPACESSSLEFHMMYSAYKLNKQGDNMQAFCTPFPILNHFFIPYLVLTAASWPAYRFLRSRSGGLVFLSL